MSRKTPSKKRARKNKRESERAKKKRQAQAAKTPHMVLGGPVVNGRECRFKMIICHPHSNSPQSRVDALVDTGCTVSAIRADIAQALGLPVIDRTQVNTAGGPVITDRVLARCVLYSPDGTGVEKLWRLVCVPDMIDDLLYGMDLMAGGTLKVNLVAGNWQWRLMQR